MDPKELKNLLSGIDNVDVGVIDENDLEKELEAILSGKPTTKSNIASSAQTRRSEGARPSKMVQENTYKNVKPNKPSRALNDPILDISQVERMLTSFDTDLADENDNSDDNELMSELDNIVNKSSPRNEDKKFNQGTTDPVEFYVNTDSSKQSKVPKIDQSKGFDSEILDTSDTFVTQNASQKEEHIKQITKLRSEYKRFAVKAKASGDLQTAFNYLKVSKQLDSMITNLEANQEVDMTTLPPFPQELNDKVQIQAKPVHPTQIQSDETPSGNLIENVQINPEDESKLFNAPQSANSVLEALEQRLEKFKSTLEQATNEQNASKARRLGRIVKTYENAIKDHNKGKPVNYDELPCPPGFPPIPVPQPVEQTPTVPIQTSNRPAPPKPAPSKPVPTDSQTNKPAQRPPLKRGMSTTGTKQLKFLIERQTLFKAAALDAKKRGELEQAKEYLRQSKGFDPLIEATKNGLPIDATTIPTPPQMSNDDFVLVDSHMVEKSDSTQGNAISCTDTEREELFRKVEKELIDQIEMCNRNKEFFLKMGDINSTKKFEKFSNESRKDLNMLVVRWRNGDNIPSYRTETRTFSIVVSNIEVGVNELEVEIIKAYDIPGKPEIDTYVRVEFPVPSDKPQYKKTKTVYNTINPEYNDSLKFEIDRKSRSLIRILKRHPLKLELYSKGGFLRSDTRLGAISLKLSDLETKCTIHEVIPFVEGRKALHARLEVKVKIREPFLAKQIEEIKEKWIVFG